MIRLKDKKLPVDIETKLQSWTASITAETDYPARISKAGKLWKSKRRTSTMEKVVQTLTDMCSGILRCNYCEDSAADQIEHIDPKSFYPEKTFAWPNMAYVCSRCNGYKSNKHALFLQSNGHFHEVRRSDEPPPAGTSVLLNPRKDNPAEYFTLDLSGTFNITVQRGLPPQQQKRADYTIETLKLNRDLLVRSRISAFDNYLLLLEHYVMCKERNEIEKLSRISEAIQRNHHRYVWLEMIRQRNKKSEISELCEIAPESLSW